MRYQKLHSQIWTDEKFEALSDSAKLLFVYIISCPHSNTIGLFTLPKKYIECDLNWSAKQLAEPFSELLAKQLIAYDDNTRLVLVKNHLKHNTLDNENQVKKAIGIIKSLPHNYLFFSSILEQLSKPFHKLLREQLNERLGERYSESEEEEEAEEEEEKEDTLSADQKKSTDDIVAKNGQVPYLEIQEAFNTILGDFFPRCNAMTKQRKDALRMRFKTDEKTRTLEWWREQFFPLIARSEFLTGRNGKWTNCNFDWILKPANFQKIREGTYNR
jgi:hypothetical protein